MLPFRFTADDWGFKNDPRSLLSTPLTVEGVARGYSCCFYIYVSGAEFIVLYYPSFHECYIVRFKKVTSPTIKKYIINKK